jgi:CelD/BcsL family acetyltransferase involved in cellulose biosynthesis
MEGAAVSLGFFGAEEDAKPPIRVRQVADETAIASLVAPEAIHKRLRQRWLELARHAAEPNCFSEAWFVEASLRHLQAPGDLRIITVFGGHQGSMLLGMLPVHVEEPYGRLPVRHVVNWTHFHCFLGTPLVRQGSEREFWTAVLRLLDRSDWARGFLHINGLVEHGPVHRGLVEAARALRRGCATVHRAERALLESELGSAAYYENTVRKKKRKELKRLAARLNEIGRVEFRTISAPEEVQPWAEEFLRLERSGWKGKRGSALACSAATERFFTDTVAGAFANNSLEFLRLDLDGRPIAMLVNFLAAPGSFSFKIAIDEAFARFSPGVLIQIENYRMLDRAGVAWMDSCAVEDHPMINSLWGERRKIVRVTVALAGPVRRTTFRLCRLAESTSALLRRMRRVPKVSQVKDDD